MKIEIIVFDLYNTLIETGHSKNFFKEMYQQSNNGFDISYAAYRAILLKHPIEKVLTQLPSEFQNLYQENQEELQRQLASIQLFPETKEVLKNLSKQYPLYLISNLASPYKQAYFDLNLDPFFTHSIFSCDRGWIKPEKEIFKLVEQHSGKQGQQILMIGDSKKADIKGAKQMKWLYLRIDRRKQQLKKYEIGHLQDINSILSASKY